MSPFAPALYLADEHYLVPFSNSPEYLEIMLNLCKKKHINLVIPTRDEELPWFAEHKALFTEVGAAVMVPSPTSVEICQDKKLFIKFCQTHNYDTPKTHEKIEAITELDFPLFAKPRYGKGGKQATRIDSRPELSRISGQLSDVIIQEYIQWPEYTIDLFMDFSGQVISAVPRERLYVFGGESFVSKTAKHPILIEESVRLAINLDLVGHNTIQAFFAEGTVKFIEVNPRFGGAAHLGFVAGAPSPLFLIKLMKGDKLEARVGDFQENLVMMRYTKIFSYQIVEILATTERFSPPTMLISAP